MIAAGRVIVVDYEELHRLAHVWSAAARALAGQAAAVAAVGVEPAIAANAVLDPIGAARLEYRLGVALTGGSGGAGLAVLAARLAADAVALDAVVTRERLADDLPIAQVATVGRWLATTALRAGTDPVAAAAGWRASARTGERAVIALLDATATYAMPYLEPILAVAAPSARFRYDVITRRPVAVDPLLGVPLPVLAGLAPDGPGRVSVSTLRPVWAATAPRSLGAAVGQLADLENANAAVIAVQRIAGGAEPDRYVVYLPGMRTMGESADPLDLPGAAIALVTGSSAYARCVRLALDAAQVPVGAPVMLVGHSQGGIVAMDLAADPEFNGRRVAVTHVVAAGSPISAKRSPATTRVLSAENSYDLVPHLDALESGPGETGSRLTFSFADDLHDLAANHDPALYAQHLRVVDDSPNPLVRSFVSTAAPYFSGPARTTIFQLYDR